MKITVNIEDKELQKALKQLSQKLNDLKPPLNHVGYHLMEIVNDSFENEASPDGKKWKDTSKLNPKYLDYKIKIGKEKILHISGHLVHSIDFETTSDSVTLGTNLIYASIHQFGGRAGRGHKSKIPARPFLPVTKDGEMYKNVIEDIVEIFKDYLVS